MKDRYKLTYKDTIALKLYNDILPRYKWKTLEVKDEKEN